MPVWLKYSVLRYSREFFFMTTEKLVAWDLGVRKIKLALAALQNEYDQDGVPEDVRAEGYRVCFELVTTFIGSGGWGRKNLPPDIMVMTNDAERRIGHRETTWGRQWLAVSGESIGSDHREVVRVGYLGGAWFRQYRFYSVADYVMWDVEIRGLKYIHSEMAFLPDADCERWLGYVAETAHRWGVNRFPPTSSPRRMRWRPGSDVP